MLAVPGAPEVHLVLIRRRVVLEEHVARADRDVRAAAVALEDLSLLGANYGIGADSIAARGVGYVPQDASLFSTLTVRDHLAFALHAEEVPEGLLHRYLAGRPLPQGTGRKSLPWWQHSS